MKHGRNVLDLELYMIDGLEHWTRFKSGSVGLLALMPNLEKLDLYAAGEFLIPSHDMYVMQHLTSLQDLTLDLSCPGEWDERLLQPLNGLKNLNQLDISVSGMTTPLLLHSSLSTLTGITKLHLATYEKDSAEELIDTANIVSVVSNLTGLRWLDVTGVMDTLPASLLNLDHLSTLNCGSCNLLWPGPSSLPDIQGWHCLKRIWMGRMPAMKSEVWHALCQMLSLLPRLSVLTFFGIDLAHICSRSWLVNQRLQTLSFIDCDLSSLPTSLEHLSQLHSFALVNAAISLKDLGHLLEQLQVLELTMQHAVHASAELRAAKSLTKLVLRHDWRADRASLQPCICENVEPWLPASCVLSCKACHLSSSCS